MTNTALTLTALEAVQTGQCSGLCLVASPDNPSSCDCRCAGAFHGALADVEVTAQPIPSRAPDCGANAPGPLGFPSIEPGIHCELPAGHPPHPAQYVHHAGNFGSWLEEVP
jgi:hypothetical protein